MTPRLGGTTFRSESKRRLANLCPQSAQPRREVQGLEPLWAAPRPPWP